MRIPRQWSRNRRVRDPPRQESRPGVVRIGVLLQYRLDDVAWPLADLRVDTPHIFTQQSDAEQGYSDQQEHHAEQREQPFGFGSHPEAPHHQGDEGKRREQRDHHADHRKQLQRYHRETRDQVEIQTDQAVHRIFRPPRMAFFVSNRNFYRVHRIDRGQRGDEGVHLARLIERGHHGACVAAHHAALIGDAYRRDPFADLVDGLGKRTPPQRILTLLADGAHVVETFVQLADQLADFLRWVLQVRIQCHHILASRVGEPRHHRRVLAEIGMEQHHPRFVRTFLELLAQQRHRTVPAAVVHEHDLVANLQRIERRIESREQRRQYRLFVVHGDDDTEFR